MNLLHIVDHEVVQNIHNLEKQKKKKLFFVCFVCFFTECIKKGRDFTWA